MARKRFIAGAVCPHCQEKDTLTLWWQGGVEGVECVECGFQMNETDKVQKEIKVAAQHGEVIQFFKSEK